jgi:hypothetical protein
MGARTYKDFGTDVEKTPRKVMNDAGGAAAKPDSALVKAGSDAALMYARWFGLPGGVLTFSAMQSKIHKMASAMHTSRIGITYNRFCGEALWNAYSSATNCGTQNIGQIRTNVALNVDLCPSFFSGPTERGDNSMTVTLMHELSHAVLGTIDAIHPMSGALCDNRPGTMSLVATPAPAGTNAENVAQFICEFLGRSGFPASPPGTRMVAPRRWTMRAPAASRRRGRTHTQGAAPAGSRYLMKSTTSVPTA